MSGRGAKGGLWDLTLQEAPMLYCGEHIGTGQDPMVRSQLALRAHPPQPSMIQLFNAVA